LGSYIPSTEVLLPVHQKIALMITKGELMLFLCGTLEVPQCPNSLKMVTLLTSEPYKHLRERIATFDLDRDAGIKQALVKFSNLNEIPQLYFQGKLVGATDQVTKMHKSGELKKLFESAESHKEESKN
jgi:monothiol glutaredoxin